MDNNAFKLPWELILLLCVITLAQALGQYLLRLYKDYPTLWWLPFCCWICYGLITYLLLISYNYTTMGKAEVFWDSLSSVLIPIIGIYAFNNKLSLVNWIGIILTVIGGYMVTIQANNSISKIDINKDNPT